MKGFIDAAVGCGACEGAATGGALRVEASDDRIDSGSLESYLAEITMHQL